MTDHPFAFTLPLPSGVPTRYDNHLTRTLSSMRGQYLDEAAFERQLAKADSTVYEVYEFKGLEVAGELFMGVSVIHPGKVGNEFYMTKGHYHTVRETGEIYYCLKGEGFMVMETSQGETAVEALCPAKVLYVAPSWAHRSVCTSRQDDLVLFFAYPGNAGHDYGTIEAHGFRKLILDGPDGLQIVDNPRWRAQ
jgi:glucose-6-phosphate isomerase, archaeal